MSTPAVYRFLPFTRRGLVAELRDGTRAAAGPLPLRASVQLDVTLSGGHGTHSTSTDVAGPGDVVGLDPRAIVRLSPRRDASNVEPNYLVAVDFDDPDLPWLATPSAADARGRLRPWLALVVVEERPGVSVSVPPGAPLPQLRIEHGARRELPGLTGSWAWAHTQLLVAEGSGLQAAGVLQSDPDRHVSRLLCPRRLRADARWLACLVPAFDAGVRRGLGLDPVGAEVGPAWTDEDAVTLPLYFHWSFDTGAAGDFESLARRLQPFVVADDASGSPTVGTVPLHIGAAGGPVDLPEGHPGRVVPMDGALRAVRQRDGRLEEIPTAFTTALAEVLDAIADPSGTDADDGAVGPPLYGAWAANRFAVATSTGWFRELNLDPRTRVAAGLGAEVVRQDQEDLVAACWEQIGSVLAANALLARAGLSIAASTQLHARTIGRLSADRALAFAAPLADRAALDGATVRAAIGPTSLPAATVDPAMRRLLAPTNRYVRKASVDRTAASAVAGRFVSKLAAGSMAVDPTDFVPAGVRPPGGETAPPPPPAPDRLALRGDLRATGLVTTRHVEVIRRHASVFLDIVGAVDPLAQLRSFAGRAPSPTVGFVLGRRRGGGLEIAPVDRNARGDLVLRTAPTVANEVVARADGRRRLDGPVRLPPDLVRPGQPPPVVRPGPGRGDIVVRPPGRGDPSDPVPGSGEFEGPTVTVPPLVRDALVLNRFEAAIAQVADVAALADAAPERALVAFAIDRAAAALVARCHPSTAHTARVGSMVRLGDATLTSVRAGETIGSLTVAPQADRIMAYPELGTPAYGLLARHDRTRLLPGVDAIPPDSVTLLETNPRFVGAFLAGLNHELNRELLWRRYPTDQRGTPVRRFWDRAAGGVDVAPMHDWRPEARSLADVAGGRANLVLLLRGELLRRYPNTVVLAVPADGPATPSADESRYEHAVFAGVLEPDVSFFGFDLTEDDLRRGDGWFFALQEQVTEPRFGLDEVRAEGGPTGWRQAAWGDTGILPGATFDVEDLRRTAADRGLEPVPSDSAMTAEALFQNPVQVLVHARHLVALEEA